jgi:hypothetical protein
MASPVFRRVIVNCPISDEILIHAAASDKAERDKVKNGGNFSFGFAPVRQDLTAGPGRPHMKEKA